MKTMIESRSLWIAACLLIALILMAVGLASAQPAEPNLMLFVDENSLTLYVAAPEPVSLAGLGFGVINSVGEITTFNVEEYFDALRLTRGVARSGACYVYRLAGAADILPHTCRDLTHVFIRLVPASDVFWFNTVTNLPRDLAIYSDGQPTGDVCPAALPECPVYYVSIRAPEPTTTATTPADAGGPPPTPAPTATPTPVEPEAALEVAHNADWEKVIQDFYGIEMALVPPGRYMMGENGARGEQIIPEAFWLGRYEVTNAQYGECVDAGVCNRPAFAANPDYSDPEQPVVGISAIEAEEYADWLSDVTGLRWSLPNEARWEYAARGPDGLPFPWGSVFDRSRLNYCDANCPYEGRDTNYDDGYRYTAPIGSYPRGASWVGAEDMSGNVYEWTTTVAGYAPETRVIRGGGWDGYEVSLSTFWRAQEDPDERFYNIGFRIMMIPSS